MAPRLRGGGSIGFLMAIGLWSSSLCAAAPPSQPLGWAALHRLDLLPAYKPSIQIGMASSYDRSGGDDDGFSGGHSVLRKEPAGLVIADIQGPGVIHRIWTPTPSDDSMDFYFDGDAPTVLCPAGDFFGYAWGEPAMRSLLVGADAQTTFCYFPMPFDGQYQIQLVTVKGPDQGSIQLFQDEVPVGDPIDLYAAQPEKSGRLILGTLPFRQGNNEIMLKIVGKNDAATALGLDLVEIVCTRKANL